MLRDSAAKLKKAGRGHETLIRQAERALVVDESIVSDLKNFTHDTQALRKARASMARLIERIHDALAAAN